MYLFGNRTNSMEFIIFIIAFIILFSFAGCTMQNKKTVTSPGGAASPAESEREITGESMECIACHERRGVANGSIADWEASKHAQKGVGCEVCHVNPVVKSIVKEAIEQGYLPPDGSSCENKGVYRKVVAGVCGECHGKQYNEFMMSRHSMSWKRAIECSEDVRPHDETYSARCEQCHNIQFKCDSCHIRHTFSTFGAKAPETCRSCHTGADHPQYDIFISSKHGTLHSASQSSILKEPESKQSLRYPICTTCHMPQGTHDVSFGLTRRPVGISKSYIDRNGIVADDITSAGKRDAMLSVCIMCHSASFAEDTLITADNIYKDIETIGNEAKEILAELEKKDLLSLPLNEKAISQYPYHADILGSQQYNGKSKMYYIFSQLIKNAAVSWKSAYHLNPNYGYLYGLAELHEDLREVKAEAGRLHEEAEIKRKMGIKLR